jgi:hypothetical protein
MLIALLIARPAGGEEILPRLPVAQRKQLRLLGGIGQRQQPAIAEPSFRAASAAAAISSSLRPSS